ncbi:hypothetical protein E2C01_074176 [Portunus trituberculatus]|uniref:Uncharacterized protein n=1 Tax=Portunus trituberculatus TaxID=210409 RepID=A0A5B7ICN0_PORTR|nr:hypothetical protein [Portunus trituberculatus]
MRQVAADAIANQATGDVTDYLLQSRGSRPTFCHCLSPLVTLQLVPCIAAFLIQSHSMTHSMIGGAHVTRATRAMSMAQSCHVLPVRMVVPKEQCQ